MRSNRLLILIVIAIVLTGGAYASVPYTRAASLFVRTANLGRSESRDDNMSDRSGLLTRFGRASLDVASHVRGE